MRVQFYDYRSHFDDVWSLRGGDDTLHAFLTSFLAFSLACPALHFPFSDEVLSGAAVAAGPLVCSFCDILVFSVFWSQNLDDFLVDAGIHVVVYRNSEGDLGVTKCPDHLLGSEITKTLRDKCAHAANRKNWRTKQEL
jgi:hypothetical protein